MDRRTLKRDKGDRLDLQQQLQAEIAAKTRIQEELTQITSQYTDMERYIVKTLSPRICHGCFCISMLQFFLWCSRVQQAEAEEKALRKENERLKQQLEHAKLGKPPIYSVIKRYRCIPQCHVHVK